MFDYRKAAECLVERALNRCEVKVSPHEREMESLYFWLWAQMSERISNSLKNNFCLKVQEKYSPKHQEVILINEHNLAEYCSKFVERQEFYAVVEEITSIFYDLPNFCSDCRTPISGSSLIEMNLELVIQKKENV